MEMAGLRDHDLSEDQLKTVKELLEKGPAEERELLEQAVLYLLDDQEPEPDLARVLDLLKQGGTVLPWFRLLFHGRQDLLESQLGPLLEYASQDVSRLRGWETQSLLEMARLLLHRDHEKYFPLLDEAVSRQRDVYTLREVAKVLLAIDPERYRSKALEYAATAYGSFPASGEEMSPSQKNARYKLTMWLIEAFGDQGRELVIDYRSSFFSHYLEFCKVMAPGLTQPDVGLLVDGFTAVDESRFELCDLEVEREYYRTLFQLLQGFDYREHREAIAACGERRKKPVRKIFAQYLDQVQR